MQVYCGECQHYQGSEKVPNPKSAFRGHAWRVKCAIGKSKTYVGDLTTLPDSHYHCKFYVPSEKTTERKRKLEWEWERNRAETRNTFGGPIKPATMTKAARWHNSDCGKLNGKKRCTCTCGWAKLKSTSWRKFIRVYGWRKTLKIWPNSL